ncbi:hypothetical protein HYC85_004544 [Camellia sinensis]|uniref:Uncharacterized protein n=1 Tax=Camellia sinensis TaxID=4442 RepID=A0A7J7HXG2_CAMSI|nr:hypothetical protein HYC85_004544 [Camellia sinensis]
MACTYSKPPTQSSVWSNTVNPTLPASPALMSLYTLLMVDSMCKQDFTGTLNM